MNFILAAYVRNGATAKYCLGDWSAGQIKCCAMPADDHCCVPDCNNRWNRNPELSFHTFPKNKEQKRRWILAIKRDEGPAFKVTNSTVVCSAHFLPSDYAVGQRQHRWTSGLSSTKKK